MKSKRFNILFAIMMVCLIIIVTEDVYAASCAYKYDPYGFDNNAWAIIEYKYGRFNVDEDGARVGSMELGSGIIQRESVDGKTIMFCPKKLYYHFGWGYVEFVKGYPSDEMYVTGESGVRDFSEGNPAYMYDLGETKDGIKICTTGFLETQKQIVDSAKSELKKCETASDMDLKNMSDEELKQWKEAYLEQYNYITNESKSGTFAKSKFRKDIFMEAAKDSCLQFVPGYIDIQNIQESNKVEGTEVDKEKNPLYFEVVEADKEYGKCLRDFLTKVDEVLVDRERITQEEADVNSENLNKQYDGIENGYKASFDFKSVESSDRVFSCEGLIADELEAVIKWVLKVVRIAAPILVIILATVDFSQAVISNDKDALAKATSKVVKRAIAALALFLVPLFVSVAIDWIDDMVDGGSNMDCTEVIE